MAVCSVILSEIIYAFAPNYKYFYAGEIWFFPRLEFCIILILISGILPDIFFTVPPIVLRSLMAKVVPENELGRSNSVLGLSEALVPLIFGPMYSGIYKSSITIFPGSFYFISIALYATGMALFMWVFIQLFIKKISYIQIFFRYFGIETKSDISEEEQEKLKNDGEASVWRFKNFPSENWFLALSNFKNHRLKFKWISGKFWFCGCGTLMEFHRQSRTNLRWVCNFPEYWIECSISFNP